MSTHQDKRDRIGETDLLIRKFFQPVDRRSFIFDGRTQDTQSGRSFARLTPAAVAPDKPAKVNFQAQLRAVWGGKVFSAAEVRALRDTELGSRS